MNLPVMSAVLMVICIYYVSKKVECGFPCLRVRISAKLDACKPLSPCCQTNGIKTSGVAQHGYTCGSNMAAVCPGAYVVCSCTISSTNSQYNQWNFSNGYSIQLKRTGEQCPYENQFCGPFRAWNEPSYNGTVCDTSTILINASLDLDGLTFECQDGTNGINGTPISYGKTVLSVISTPEIPRISNVESDNPTALTIEWSPAQNGSRPNSFNVAISNYDVSDPLHSASVAVGDGRSLPYSYTFTGLISDTDYDIYVVAINCAGNSTVCKLGVKTDDGFKESIMYAGIFLGLILIVVLVLCAAMLYKYRKRTNVPPGNSQGYETLPQPPECRHDSSPTPNDETDQNPPDDPGSSGGGGGAEKGPVSTDQLSEDDLWKVLDEVMVMASKWHSLGLALKLKPSELDTISSKNHNDSDECLKYMLLAWLQQRGYDAKTSGQQPSWRLLCQAISKPAGGNNPALAITIGGRHSHKRITM